MSAPMITVIFLVSFCLAVFGNPIQTRDFSLQNTQNAGAEFLQSLKGLGDALTPKQKTQLNEIATNPSSTKQQVVDGLQNFFRSIGGDAEARYTALIQNLEAESKKLQEAVKKEEASMSEEEKQFVEKANAINANMGITYAENTKQIQDLINSLSLEMKAKLKNDILKFVDALKNIQM